MIQYFLLLRFFSKFKNFLYLKTFYIFKKKEFLIFKYRLD